MNLTETISILQNKFGHTGHYNFGQNVYSCCDQLSRQNEALDQVKQEIKEWEKAKTEYQEIVIQMQNKGIFLGIVSVPIVLGSVPAMPDSLKTIFKIVRANNSKC